MKLKHWMTLVLVSGLLSGCATLIPVDTYCDLAKPHLFEDQSTVEWLVRNDRQLLVDTVVHNETYDRQCGKEN
jgi:hypothetical protein